MIDELDPIGRLDLALGAHHLLDLGQRGPCQVRREHRRDDQDQQAGDRRVPALDHALGVGQEFGQPVAVGEALPPAPQHELRPAAGGVAWVLWRCRARAKLATSPGVPSRWIRPSTRNSTRSATASAPRRWVTMITVRPRDARFQVDQERLLGQPVERAGRLVEHQKAGIADQRAHADQLVLAGREAAAALAEPGVVAAGQALDEVVRADELGSGHDALELPVDRAERDVLGDRAGEQLNLWGTTPICWRSTGATTGADPGRRAGCARARGDPDHTAAWSTCSCRSPADRPRRAPGPARSPDRRPRAPARRLRCSGRPRPRTADGRVPATPGPARRRARSARRAARPGGRTRRAPCAAAARRRPPGASARARAPRGWSWRSGRRWTARRDDRARATYTTTAPRPAAGPRPSWRSCRRDGRRGRYCCGVGEAPLERRSISGSSPSALTVSAWYRLAQAGRLGGRRLEAGLDQPVVAPAGEDREQPEQRHRGQRDRARAASPDSRSPRGTGRRTPGRPEAAASGWRTLADAVQSPGALEHLPVDMLLEAGSRILPRLFALRSVHRQRTGNKMRPRSTTTHPSIYLSSMR